MKTIRSSQNQGGTRPATSKEVNSSMQALHARDGFLCGALEYDHDHGDEVLAAKRENAAQGHCLFGAE
jgi:hypothetical protein